MMKINIKDYNEKMGKLIDVQHPLDYKDKHDPRSINIYADKLMYNPSKYLNYYDTYYIMCNKGVLSSKVVHRLTYLGYKVVQIVY